MGYGAARGTIHIECPDDCTSIQHILVERDYEDVPWASNLIIGPHEELVDAITLPIKAYFEYVEEDHTFFLFPATISTIELTAQALATEVEEAERQAREEVGPDKLS